MSSAAAHSNEQSAFEGRNFGNPHFDLGILVIFVVRPVLLASAVSKVLIQAVQYVNQESAT